jgi:hypothetical protein
MNIPPIKLQLFGSEAAAGMERGLQRLEVSRNCNILAAMGPSFPWMRALAWL